MPTYRALVTVTAPLDPDGVEVLADALGADRWEAAAGAVRLWVAGEAPDEATAEHAARRHAAEVLDDLPHRVELTPDPAP